MADLTNEEQCEALLEFFEDNENTLGDDLEVIANVLVRLGCQYIEPPLPQGSVSTSTLLEFVTEHRQRYGETIPTAAVFQGLILLNWLQAGRENK